MRRLARSIMHNCIVHPLLPIAAVLDALGVCSEVSRALDRLHDATAPMEPT